MNTGDVHHKRAEQPAHSRVLHAGDPAEEVYMQHIDGSYTSVRIAAIDDRLVLDMRTSSTHTPRLRGVT